MKIGCVVNGCRSCAPRSDVHPCRSGRFGYEYFEKLSTVTVKDLFVEQVPAEAAGDNNDSPPEESELGVITLGVNEVTKCGLSWECRR